MPSTALADSRRHADQHFSGTAAPGEPVAPCPLAGLHTGLGADVDAGISKCPAFAKRVDDLQAEGWTYRYGEPGKGSFCDGVGKRIVIDPAKEGDSTAVIQTMSHETGHAAYANDAAVPMTGRSREDYARYNANLNLRDEGEATLSNIDAKRCLDRNGGPSIGVEGVQAETYEKIYDKYPDPKDRDKARWEIADVFAEGEHPSGKMDVTYRTYYEQPYLDLYDKNPPKAP